MKIDGNLRQAIRSAYNAPKEPTRTEIATANEDAIAAFVKSKKRLRDTARKLTKLRKEAAKLAKILCDEGGVDLRSGGKFELASCGDGRKRFLAAGGKLPDEPRKWGFDAKMAEIAGASEADALILLRAIGINWQ